MMIQIIYNQSISIKFEIRCLRQRSICMTSSKQRLKLAHEILDKQLEGSTLSNKASNSMSWSKQNKKPVGKQEISQIQKKLMELEKKMGEIECSSDNDDQNDAIMRQITKSRQKDRVILSKQKYEPKSNKKYDLQSEQDSEDDNKIYQKIQNKAQKPKQQLYIPQTNNGYFKPSKSQQKHNLISTKTNVHPLKQSVKSIKSRKSNKSTYSKKSIKSGSARKMVRSNSRSSVGSRRSVNGLNVSQLRQLELQNAKDSKRISNLQKQLNHYKRLCQKQQQKIEQYRAMEIQFRKLQSNFNKSQQIRKQQKKIIQNLKSKH